MKGREIHEYRILRLEGNQKKYYNEYYSGDNLKRYFDYSKGGADTFETRTQAEYKIKEIDPCNMFGLLVDEKHILWPCPQIDEDYKVGIRRWVEICESTYNWFLECVPPIYHGDGYGYTIDEVFLNSEEVTHTPDTHEGVYLACLQYKNKYYSMLMTIKEWKSRKFGLNLHEYGVEVDGVPYQI